MFPILFYGSRRVVKSDSSLLKRVKWMSHSRAKAQTLIPQQSLSLSLIVLSISMQVSRVACLPRCKSNLNHCFPCYLHPDAMRRLRKPHFSNNMIICDASKSALTRAPCICGFVLRPYVYIFMSPIVPKQAFSTVPVSLVSAYFAVTHEFMTCAAIIWLSSRGRWRAL